jgi:hypothetical protein
MNFYTRVLSRFALNSGLLIRVEVEASLDGSVASTEVEDATAALRELLEATSWFRSTLGLLHPTVRRPTNLFGG